MPNIKKVDGELSITGTKDSKKTFLDKCEGQDYHNPYTIGGYGKVPSGMVGDFSR
jgi:hypothetical protein